jgi:hypothetical protein
VVRDRRPREAAGARARAGHGPGRAGPGRRLRAPPGAAGDPGHIDDIIEWHSVELPGCEGEGAFDLEAVSELADMFAPPLRKAPHAKERTLRVTHQALAGVAVSYTVELSNGQRDTARIVFF